MEVLGKETIVCVGKCALTIDIWAIGHYHQASAAAGLIICAAHFIGWLPSSLLPHILGCPRSVVEVVCKSGKSIKMKAAQNHSLPVSMFSSAGFISFRVLKLMGMFQLCPKIPKTHWIWYCASVWGTFTPSSLASLFDSSTSRLVRSRNALSPFSAKLREF